MEKQRSPFTLSPKQSTNKSKDSTYRQTWSDSPSPPSLNSVKSPNKPIVSKDSSKPTKKAKGYCVTPKSSGTQYYRRARYGGGYEKITSDQYVGLSESVSGFSSFQCVHGPKGKQYTAKGLLKQNLLKELDPIPFDQYSSEACPPNYGWDVAKKLEFLVTDPVAVKQDRRLADHILDLARISDGGYIIDLLPAVTVVVDYLVETYKKKPELRDLLVMLLTNMERPVLLKVASDVVKYSETFRTWIGYMGYLLMRLEDDDMFRLVSDALIWQLSASDSARGAGSAHLRHVLAAAPVLCETTARMLAIADKTRFSTFLEIALVLACDNADNCIEMMKENVVENIFYRFNPYFPERKLPAHDINPADPQDFNVQLGESSVNMPTTLSLLLVLLKTTKEYLDTHTEGRCALPCPDAYSQRCFTWAYRYECRARERQSERSSLTVIAAVLLRCFGNRLSEFFAGLMPDVMSLSVLTEVPRDDWLGTINFNTAVIDVQFKKTLINLSVDFLKLFPPNNFMIESRHWLLGLMYLIDPDLCVLRAKWSSALFAELRKTALQALVCTLPLAPVHVAKDYGLTRRIMWYIEWYSENPFDISVLYWCLRLLVVVADSKSENRDGDPRELFDTHGLIIIIHLCYTLLEQKTPPLEKSQVILSLCLRLITRAVDANQRLTCCVYPSIKWPASINFLAKKMIDVVLHSLDKHYIISDRWLVALMDFIWEGIIRKAEFRAVFVADNGIYKLLDLITMTRPSVQCIALGMVSDVVRAGDAVGQLVSWRATVGASRANPILVKRGATIAALLAAIFRDECLRTGVHLDENGIIQNMDCPLMSTATREAMAMIKNPQLKEDRSQRTSACLTAGDLAGSRLSKVFALLHMLSDDLEYSVSIADEAYNMYKNIKLAPEDEAVLLLCSHYLTVKLNEVWLEVRIQCPDLLPHDDEILEEFLHNAVGWAKEIKRQQEDVIRNDKKKKYEEECSLYAFIARARLNIALDALREVRCAARTDRGCMTHALIHEAVVAHHRRSVIAKKMDAPVLRTYQPSLDDQNVTGQNVKVYSIHPKDKPKPKELSIYS